MKVYLCGGINGLSDSDAKDWREQAKVMLAPLETLDPMRRDYRGVEAANVHEIVHGDLKDISECDVVLAMCARPSWGTAMEIFYAHTINKPVFSVVPNISAVSPWLAFHSVICVSLEYAVAQITLSQKESAG